MLVEQAFMGFQCELSRACDLSEKNYTELDLIIFVCYEEQHKIQPQQHAEQWGLFHTVLM